MRYLATCLLVLLVHGNALLGQCQTIETLACGETKGGSFDASTDCRWGWGSEVGLVDLWEVVPPLGWEVEIEMQSAEIDPVLQVGPRSGVVLAVDDDSGGGTTARLRIISPLKEGLMVQAFLLPGREYVPGASYTLTAVCREPKGEGSGGGPEPGTDLEVTGRVLASRRVSPDRAEVDLSTGDGADGALWIAVCTREKRNLGTCLNRVSGETVTLRGKVETQNGIAYLIL